MTVLGLQNEENLHACRWELNQRSSYTVTTLGHFSSESRQHQYCFIAGSDSLKEIHLWKDCGRLLREHCFLFVQRPGTEVDLDKLEIAQPLRTKIQLVSATSKPSIGDGCSFLVTLKTPPISSTSIRERIGVGEVPFARNDFFFCSRIYSKTRTLWTTSRPLLKKVCEAIEGKKGESVTIFDVSGVSSFTDFLRDL